MTIDQVLVNGCTNPGLSWAENNAPEELVQNSEAVMFAAAAYNAGVEMQNKNKDVSRSDQPQPAVETLTHAATTETVGDGTAPILCAMCERQFDDDEMIRVVEFRLVCEDCYHDLPEAE